MKGKWKKRILTATTAALAGLLMSTGIPQLALDLSKMTLADSTNLVTLTSTSVEADSSGLVFVDIHAEGAPGDVINVVYRTSSGTAIENVDFSAVYNTASLTINLYGSADYKVSIKCLNDAYTREKLRVYDGNTTFGRYFNLSIVSATNATIVNDNCKCYLPYDYRVSATTNIDDSMLGRKIAYLDDYKEMLSKYHKGDNDISGKETWKTWKEGVSFNDDTTRRWINTYINPGFANAYSSYILESIDDDKLHSESNIHMLSGNKQFMDQYSRSNSCPGLSLWYEIEPCKKGGYRLDGRAMYYISQNTNPYSKIDSDLVDLESLNYVSPNRQRINWIQQSKAWFSSANSLYYSMFYKTEPYNGVLDYGLAIYNGNKSWDREVHNIWLFMTLVDNSAPVLREKYSEYNPVTESLRIYLRFNEPVYASKRQDLSVKINELNTVFNANYVDGNFSDTLVYEIPGSSVPKRKINRISYQLHNNDISDMAYILDEYKNVSGNFASGSSEFKDTAISGGGIDLIVPQLAVDKASQPSPKAVHDIMLSANGNGDTAFDTGVVYYSWDKNNYISNPLSPGSYANTHVLTSEERGSFSVTLSKNEALGITSGDYYLHALVVSQYGMTAADTFGPYRLDGDAPEVKQLEPLENQLRFKNLRLEVKDKALGTSLDKINAIFKYADENGVEQVATKELLSGGAVPSGLSGVVISNQDSGATIYQYRSNIDEADTSVPLDEFVLNLMGERARLTADISFEVVDEAGNKSKTSPLRVVYDRRELFENAITVPASYQKDESIDVSCDVFDISGATSEDGITFTLPDAESKALIDEGAKYSVLVNGETTYEADSYSVTLKGLSAGYYEAVGLISGESGGTSVDMVSKAYSFYLTNSFNDDTTNKLAANGNLVLSNRVFQLEDARFYYFKSSSSSSASYLYGATYNESMDKFEGGSNTPTFSTSIEAKKYVKFMEYRDLELISITDTIASLLNSSSGSTIYTKAAKETRNALQGQLWIRYKKTSWTSTAGSNGWAFYYYGEGNVEDGINYNGLSSNLNASIDAVTNRIIASGKDRYLVGEDYTDRFTGAPSLAQSQIHVESETYDQTMSGNRFLSNPIYAGDEKLFNNAVSIEDHAYPLATNLALSMGSSTTLYFKHLGASEWTRLEASDGMTLGKALANQATGLYSFREYGDKGVGEFTAYIDHSLPTLNITVDKDLESEATLNLDGSVTSVSGTSVTLNGLLDEVDTQTYVAIYSYPNRVLQTVLYANEIANYTLSGGNYYLQVGDRSGNIVTYTVWTSDTPIVLSAAENEAKTGVIVRVENRDDSEIYSYEVYLNETLIDTEFAAYKLYRGAGLYRIEVIDIYGNRETLTYTHESPSPELTWYYLNDNGGYSVYDPNKPVKMVLEDDPTSSRTTNVYSSTMVRVVLNTAYESDEVEFEVLDIPSTDYTYNPTTGLLSINTLSNWRLRVWYHNQPENDRLYVFSIDADSPEVSATIIGTGYQPYVLTDEEGNIISTSNFDGLNFDIYEDGDVVILDTLAYETLGQANMTFHSGNIVSGNHIVLHLSDRSGIRSVVTTRNGVVVDAVLNEDNELILNGTGYYVVTIIDNLGNQTTFTFTNVEADISKATLDGEILTQDTRAYGHGALDIETQYEGTNTILIEVGGIIYTYEFHHENGVLTYGQYYIVSETYEDEGELVESKSAEYVQAPGFILNSASGLTNPNVYYAAVESEYFAIYAMIDDAGKAHYRILSLGPEVRVETRFDVGSVHLPNRYVASLSLEAPSITLLTGGKAVERIESLEYIFVADDLTIDPNTVGENIVSIEYSYSETNVFGEHTRIYKDGEWLADFLGENDGYYRIIVTNKYGNMTVYLISKIEAFASIVTIHCIDGSSVTFSQNEPGKVFYSNLSVELIVYSTEVQFKVDGTLVSGYLSDNVTILTLTRDGHYNVEVIGANGVFESFEFEIKSDDEFVFEETWIIGYNEEALLRDQGYTNSLCSIVLDEDVVYVDMTVNDDRYFVLYDNITDNKVTDLNALVDAIGRYGVGKYVVGFRNKYGDLTMKTVHYNNIPSIVLTRSISSDPQTKQVYDLGLAVEKGFYSNYIMYFSTNSENYEFTIDGVSYRLDEPKTLEFSNLGGTGSFSHDVTYLDEYGNFVEFKAILSREEVTFDTSTMTTLTVGSTLYTRDDISITFGPDLKATLTIDDGETKDYVSGEMHYADGEYRFVVRDIAGNNVTFVIVHKSVNHYTLTMASTGEDVIDGGVVNNSNVVFYSEDGSKIKYVVRNGELVTDYNSNTFSSTGHYEIIIEDQIGNQSYEEFTILNNSLESFTYKPPFEYEIDQIWVLTEDGRELMEDFPRDSLHLDKNGNYLVVVRSTKTAASFNFSVSIDRTPPTATLSGVENGGVTGRDVSVTGLKVGDVVKIYKDGELVSTTVITLSSDAPKITTGGRYRITITNLQGVTISYDFTRKSIANVPASIFIIVFSVLVVTAVGIGLTYHTKLKTDD